MNLLLIQIFNGSYRQVLQKIDDQFKSLKKINSSTDCILINMGNPDIDFSSFSFRTINLRAYNILPDYWNRKKATIDIASSLIRQIKPDLVYMRYPLGDEYTLSLVNEFDNIVFEHHTIETEELGLFQDKTFVDKEFKYGPQCIIAAKGVTAVSRSVLEYELNRSDSSKPHFISSNGISESYKLIPSGVQPLKPISILSLSSFQKWHALDRLIEGLKIYPCVQDFKLYLAGEGGEYGALKNLVNKYGLNENVIFCGKINPQQIKVLAAGCHIAAGSLGHHRLNITHASPIKHREYTLLGLPLVFSCLDEDINSSLPFVLQLPQDNSPIDFHKIKNFALSVYSNENLKNEIVNWGINNITWDAKSQSLLDFLNTLVSAEEFSFNEPLKSEITVGIPTRNRLNSLLRLIDSLTRQTFRNFELLISDDGGNYDLETLIKSMFPKLNCKVIPGPKINLPANRQNILNNASCSLIVMCDDDHVMEPNCLMELVSTAVSSPGTGIVSAVWPGANAETIEFDKVKHLEEYRLDFDNINLNSDFWFKNGWKTFCVFHKDRNILSSQFSGGGCVLYNKKAVIDAGGFPDYYSVVSFREDTDISYRVFLTGYKVLINTKAVAHHFPEKTGGCRDSENIEQLRKKDGELFLKKIDQWRKDPLTYRKRRLKIAGSFETEHDLTEISKGSAFSNNITDIFNKFKPSKIIETGTYLGTGTTAIIAEALRNLSIKDAKFYSIEVNPENYLEAKKNLTERGLIGYVNLLNGVSIPRTLLPSIEDIESTTVNSVQYDDIFVDHKETERTVLYFSETNFPDVRDDLLGEKLREFNYKPDFILLDSAGSMGFIEFRYLVNKLKGDCIIALDDIYHIKHHKSFRFMQSDPRFRILGSSKEKFGFCIAEFSYSPVHENAGAVSPYKDKEIVGCPLCGSDKSSMVYSPDIVKCSLCGFVYLKERPSQKWMENYYKNIYAVNEPSAAVTVAVPDDVNLLDVRKEYIAAQRRELFDEAVSSYGKDIKGGTIIDIGCGWGALLYNAQKHGMNVIGFEFTEHNVKYAREVLKIDIRQEQFSDSDIPDNSADIITMSHVLEHVPDPVKLVKNIFRVLKPGGIFFCVVPNFQSLCSAYLGEKWEWLDRNWHYSYFSPDSLDSLFKKSGLSVVKCSTVSGDYGSAKPFQVLSMKFPQRSEKDLKSLLNELNKQNYGEEIRIVGKKPNVELNFFGLGNDKNILWIRTDAIGDAVLSSSMLGSLKQYFKDYKITVVCRDIVSEIYELSPCVDNIISVDIKKFYSDKKYLSDLLSKLQSVNAVYAFNSIFSRDFISDYLTENCKAKYKIAHEGDLSNISKELKNQFDKNYSKLIPVNPSSKLELDRHLDFLIGIGITAQSLKPIIWLAEEDNKYAEKLFSENNLETEKTIVLFTGAQHDVRIYPDYGKAINEYCSKKGFSIIVLGSSKDQQINSENIKDLTVKVVNLTGKTTIRQSAAIIKKCTAAVGAETGLAHIACAVDTPNLILLGGGHFGRFMPYSQLTSIITLPLECFGCNWQCKYGTITCIKDVDYKVISKAFENMMEDRDNKTIVYLQSAYKHEFLTMLPKILPINKFPKGKYEIKIIEEDLPDILHDFKEAVSHLKDKKAFETVVNLNEIFNRNETNIDVYREFENKLRYNRTEVDKILDSVSCNLNKNPFYNYLRGLIFEYELKTMDSYIHFLKAVKYGNNLRSMYKLAQLTDRNAIIPYPIYFYFELLKKGVEKDEALSKVNIWKDLLSIKNSYQLKQIEQIQEPPQLIKSGTILKEEAPVISFVVPSKNRYEGLSSFLSSLKAACFGISYEVLLYAGNEISEQYSEIINKYNVKKVYLDKEIFKGDRSFSWTHLMNHGFIHAVGKWIMYASDDIVLHPLACTFAMHMCKDADTGGISFLHRNTIQDYEGFFKEYGYDLYGGRPFINFGLVRKDAFKDVKGFDETLTFYAGDTDLCWQIIKKGYNIVPSHYSLVEHINIEDATKISNSGENYRIDTYTFYKKWFDYIVKLKDRMITKERYFLLDPQIIKKHIVKTSLQYNIPVEYIISVDEEYKKYINSPKTFEKKQIKVTAIVSTYNSEKFITACLDDLINQTLYSKGELEIVVVNSGSLQNEESVIEEYQSRYKNIKYIKTERETIYSAWNRGVKQASGIYITNANTDDRHSPFAFEVMADFLDKNQNKNIDVVYADSYVTKFENENWGTKKIKGIFKWPEHNIRHLFDVCYLGPQPMWRKSLHDKLGYFDAEYQSAGDYEFWLRLSTKGINFAHLNEVFGIYYENENSVSLSNINLNWEESEKARNENWPKDWGARPKTNWKSYEIPIKDNCVEDQNRCKVLLLCDYFWPSIGGVEVFIEELGIQLQKEGYLIEVACRRLDDRHDYKHSGMIIHEFNILKSSLNTELKDEIKKCRELILNGNYKSVIVLSQPDNWIGKVIHDLPVNRPQIIMIPSISANNLIEWADNGFGENINNILKSADRIVTVSENGYDKTFLDKINIPNIFIPHSVEKDVADIDFRNEYGLDRSLPLLVMVANFWPVKNHDSLLEILSHNNGEWQIVIIGKKIDSEKLFYDKVSKLAERDKRVRVLGALERNIAAAAIRDADILLVPSKAESAGPLVILQAMSFGTPWIATPSCNAVKDEAGGLIVPVDEFPKAIESIINNKEIRNELTFLGKKHWEQSFRWNKSLPLFISLIEGQEPVSNLNMSEDLRKQTRLIQEEYSKSIPSMANKNEKIFSVIIPTYNRAAVLEKCLSALCNQNFAADMFEVIVCDDGSSDTTTELIKKIEVPYRLIYLRQENKGPAAARNMGIRKSTGKYLLILNDDAILNFDALKIHYDMQVKHMGEKISVLGAFNLLPEYTRSLLGYFVNTTDSLFNYPKMISGLLYNYEHFYTCNISILKETAVSAGLFDETFNGPAAEDIEFGYRLEQAGYRVLYEDSCIAWHDHQITLETFCKTHQVRGYGAATLSYIQPSAYPLEYLDRNSYSEWLKTMEDAEPKIKELYSAVQEIEEKGGKTDLQKNAVDLLSSIKLLQNYYVKKGILTNPYLSKIISRNSSKNNLVKAPFVSVIIPCFNYGKFLAEAVESVINQTFKDFEIIIVNDGSNDNSKEVAEDLVNKYRNDLQIRLINQLNSGQPAITRNNGIKEAKGDYILCLDADDKIAPTMLEKSMSVLEAFPDLGVAYTHRQDFDGSGQLVKASEYNFELLKRQNILSVCSLFRKKVWEEVGGYRTNVKGLEDWDFWIALGAKGYFGKLIPEPLFFYRRHDTGVFQEALKGEKEKFAQIILNNKSVYSSEDVEAAERFLQMTKKQGIDFSVIIPTFNRKDKLKKSIESVLGSSYSNFEIVIVNDAGDDVKDVVKNFNDSRIKYFEHETNKGLAASRNTGIKEAKGKFIALLDDDDIFYPDHLKIALENLNKHNRVVYTDALRTTYKKENGSYKLVDKSIPYSIDYNRNKLLIGNIAPVNCFVFEKTLVEKSGLFDESLPVLEDWDFWLRLSSLTEFKHIKESTVQVNWYVDGSTMTSSKGKDFEVARNKIYKKFENEIQKITNKNEIIEEFNSIWRNDFKTKSPTVSIIALSYNQIKYTKEFIQSVFEFTTIPFELIIIDNNSDSETVEYLKEIDKSKENTRVIFNQKNFGFPKGINQAIKEARGKYLLIANNDIVVTKGWFERIAEVAESDNKIGIVGPISNYVSGMQFDKNARYSNLKQMHEYVVNIRVKNLGKTLHFPRITFLCALIKREVIEKIGGLDERFSPGNFEDDDFCLRAQIAGFKTVIAQDVFIHHYGSKSFTAEGMEKYKTRLEINQKIFINKWGATPEEIWLKGKQIKGRKIMFTLNKNEFKENLERALSLIEEKDYDVALDYLNNSVEVYNNFDHDEHDPDLANLLNLAGNVSFLNGNPEAAQKYFENALNEDSSSSHACTGLGDVLFVSKNYESAKTMYQWGVKNNSENKAAKDGLVKVNKILNLQANDNSLSRLKEEINIPVKLNEEINIPESVYENKEPEENKLINEAYEMFNEKKFESALNKLKKAESLFNGQLTKPKDPEFASSFYNFKGFNYLGLNDIVNAKNCFQKALEINPDSSQAIAGLGEVLFLSKFDEEAKLMFEKAVNKNPNNLFAIGGLKKVNKLLNFDEDHSSLTQRLNSEDKLKIYHRDDIGKLCNKLQLLGKGAEVGVQAGEYSRTIRSTWEGEELYLIDWWRYSPNYKDIANAPDEKQKELYLSVVKKFMDDHSVHIIRKESIEASKQFSDEYFDWIYLDADHSYEGCLNDLKAWYPKLKKGGIFAGHDYFDGTFTGGIFGVKSAVDSFISDKEVNLYTTEENTVRSWYFIKPGSNLPETVLKSNDDNEGQINSDLQKLQMVLNEILESSFELFGLKHFDEAIDALNKSEDIFYSQNNKELISAFENMKGFNYLGINDKVRARECFETALNINTESSQACAGLGELFYLDGKDNEAKTMYEFAVKNNPDNQYAVTGLVKVNKILNLPDMHNTVLQ